MIFDWTLITGFECRIQILDSNLILQLQPYKYLLSISINLFHFYQHGINVPVTCIGVPPDGSSYSSSNMLAITFLKKLFFEYSQNIHTYNNRQSKNFDGHKTFSR